MGFGRGCGIKENIMDSISYDVVKFIRGDWTTLVCKELNISAGAPTEEEAWKVFEQIYISNEKVKGIL